MTGLLRYVYLKTSRDKSLPAFALMPIFFPIAALMGATWGTGHLSYPFYMNPRYTPVQNATLLGEIVTILAALFASLFAFWTLRQEFASRAVGSFVFAKRPLTIIVSLVGFAAAVGVTGSLGALGMIAALTTALPSHLAVIVLKMIAASLVAASIGTMVVAISPQPAMIVTSYLGTMVVVPMLSEKTQAAVALSLGIAVPIVCSAIATFLLERRCAA